MADQNRGRTSLAVPALSQGGASPSAEEYGNQAHKGQRQAGAGRLWSPGALTLRNWRVRWRVLALVVVPTVAAIVLGAVRVEAAGATASGFARISEVAALGRDFTTLAQSVEDERDLTAGYLASQQAGDKAQAAALLSRLQAQYGVTDTDLAAARGLAGQVSSAGSGNPQATRADVTSAMENLQVYLPDLRGFTRSQIDPLAMTSAYSQLISPLLAFDTDIGAGSPDPQLAQLASLLGSAAQVEDQASQQRALLYAALFQGQFQPGLLSALTAAQVNQASSLAAFQAAGADVAAFIPASGSTPAGFSPALTQVQQFSNLVQGPAVDDAQRIELAALVAGQAGLQPDGGAGNATEWFTDMTSALSQMRSFDATDLDAISSQAGMLHQGALGSERLTALIVLILLAAVLIVTVVVARSMILPLRRLRADALDVASRRLPEMVRRLSESDEGSGSGIEVEPIGMESTDEIGEVARAFDQVHGEAVRLAAGEATLRANLNAMFVNLSRRSQTLIERQLGMIEGLEQTEQDAGRLGSLFRLDHLATRMRRNSENLLVLAGHEAPRKWTRPVALVDVLRAAVSEIEQYERITLKVQPGLLIAGRAASDVVHLAAELVENATVFSRKDTHVTVASQHLTSGGVLIEITDEGLGIPEQELAYANWRLDNPPVIDVAVSRRMGLFVVGRLAARHGIKVRLRRATSGGLSALIWVPDTVADAEEPALASRPHFGSGGSPVTITSPAEAVAGARTPALGVRTPTRPRSIWFDTGEGDAGPAPEPPAAAAVPAVAVPAPVAAEPPAGPQPAAGGMLDGARAQLPIYDSVKSEWFRRGGLPAGGPPAGSPWASPADEGFRRAAETARSPVAGQATSAGLPRRVPSANLVPGSIGARPASQGAPQAPPEDSGPSRSPDAVRARMTGFQRRGRERHPGLPQRPGTDQN